MNDTHNAILQRLSPEEFNEFLNSSMLVNVNLRDSLIEPNKPIEFIDFVESGVISVVATADSETVEVVTVGREGMVGLPVVLGADTTICRYFCQVSGQARRIPTNDFRELMAKSQNFASYCMRYSYSLFEQAGQNSACNRLHSIEERCAKWLLLTHDRVDKPEFDLTQEFLAQMLGVRRQSVNLAAGVLQAAGIIRYSRGMIQILKRSELEDVSCECYQLIRKSFEAQLS